MAQKVKISRFGSANNAPKPPSGRFLLIGLLVLVSLIIGFTAGNSLSSNTKKKPVATTRKSAVGQVSESKYGPTKKVGRVPVGFTHSEGGAITAATAYVGITPQLYLVSEGEFEVAVSKMATVDFATPLRDGLLGSRATMRTNFQNDPNAFYREIPVANEIVSSEKDRVEISIYTIVMLISQPDFAGQTEGKMHKIELAWERGDWKVANWSTENAPTPLWSSPVPLSPVEDFIDSVGSLKGAYNYVPSL